MLEQLNKIFIADDDEDDRLLFLDAVQDLDLPASVTAAQDGRELLEILLQDAAPVPEIIFLDINMPCKSGFDCLEEIRNAEGKLKNVKIIMLSTSRSPENINLSYELGADLYAVKPSSFEGLKNLLKTIFSMDWSLARQDDKHFVLC
ncbi:response regulator [Flavobacterium plurextorum]|uniref:response regulator n=1 Tax=Flavobacterium TaxID=237 RepID=UPI00214D8073|nr:MULTISPECIES: response regulator [Flavobacterium]UUW08662.1 response regulator [Flavobacterium plurextorum]